MEKKNILLVEDSHIIQLLIQAILEDNEYNVEFVSDGKQALEYLKKNKPDILILDLMMPVMDGFKMLDRIEKPIPYPILVVTARSDFKSIGKAIELGASDYLIKPFNANNLLNKIERLLAPPLCGKTF